MDNEKPHASGELLELARQRKSAVERWVEKLSAEAEQPWLDGGILRAFVFGNTPTLDRFVRMRLEGRADCSDCFVVESGTIPANEKARSSLLAGDDDLDTLINRSAEADTLEDAEEKFRICALRGHGLSRAIACYAAEGLAQYAAEWIHFDEGVDGWPDSPLGIAQDIDNGGAKLYRDHIGGLPAIGFDSVGLTEMMQTIDMLDDFILVRGAEIAGDANDRRLGEYRDLHTRGLVDCGEETLQKRLDWLEAQYIEVPAAALTVAVQNNLPLDESIFTAVMPELDRRRGPEKHISLNDVRDAVRALR